VLAASLPACLIPPWEGLPLGGYLAVACLLALLPLPLPGGLTAAHLVTLAVIGFYFWLDVALGAAMALAMLAALTLGSSLAAGPHGWQWGAGLFALGWVIQFIGHVFEGRKPVSWRMKPAFRWIWSRAFFCACRTKGLLTNTTPSSDRSEMRA
jgi:hypothetical protein